MSKQGHFIYTLLLFVFGIGTTIIVGIYGFQYYITPEKKLSNLKADLDAKKSDLQVEIEMMKQSSGGSDKTPAELRSKLTTVERDAKYYDDWKPAGKIGHGVGIIGSAMMIIGVIMYSTRKRMKAMRQLGLLKYWLEFHIFLCLVGPTLVLYHTTFKFGGLVSVSFWSMVAVVMSGIIGRYIYTQIPRGITGNELSIDDLKKENQNFEQILRSQFDVDDRTVALIDHVSHVDIGAQKTKDIAALVSLLKDDFSRRRRLAVVRNHLKEIKIPQDHIKAIITVAKKKSILIRKIAFLGTAQRLFHYWHVVHQPFSIVMFVILFVHVIVTVSLGYRWLF